MQKLTRLERIQVVRGLINLLGIAVIIGCTLLLLKVKDVANKECRWYPPKSMNPPEPTGLYGNCTWLTDHLNKDSPEVKATWGNMSAYLLSGE